MKDWEFNLSQYTAALFLLGAMLASEQIASADTLDPGGPINLVATADGEVRTFGGDAVDTTSELLGIAQSGGNIDNVILEFDLDEFGMLPPFDSAELIVVHDRNLVNTGGVPVPVEIFAYAGDGVVTIGDFDAAASAVGTFEVPLDVANGEEVSFNLTNVDAIESAFIAGGGRLTLRIETNSFATFEFASLENPTFAAPTLRLGATAVPEPGSVAALGLLAVGIVARRRRI